MRVQMFFRGLNNFWLGLFSLLLLGTHSLAQDIPLPPIEIGPDTVIRLLDLDAKYWQILDDPDGKLAYEDVMDPLISIRFHKNEKGSSAFEDIFPAYWMRYNIKNSLDREVTIYYPITAAAFYSKLYVIRKGYKAEELENGFFTPRSRAGKLKFSGLLPLRISPGEVVTIYNRISNRSLARSFWAAPPVSPSFSLSTNLTPELNQSLESQYSLAVHDSILFGILLFASILNMIFFLIGRARIHLYFSIYMVLLGIGRMPDELYAVFLRETPAISVALVVTVWGLTSLFMTIFIRSLLLTKLHFPRWDKVLAVLSWATVFFYFAPNLIAFFLHSLEAGHPEFESRLFIIAQSALLIANLVAFFMAIAHMGKPKNVLILAVTVALLIWAAGWLMAMYPFFFQSLKYPGFVYRVGERWDFIETICLTWMALFFCGILFQQFRQMQKQVTNLETQVLRTQMNPHFIFNSLNSINLFILQNNRDEASSYLGKFAKLVRKILENSKETLIDLESELESVRLYLSLESARFGDRFEYDIIISDDIDMENVKVPPLIIQPFLENSIWHGLTLKEGRGRVELRVERQGAFLIFRIIDNGVGRRKDSAKNGKPGIKHEPMGLKITSQRILRMFRNKPEPEEVISILDLENDEGKPSGTEVSLKIPLVYD
ncbi:MAG: hypothetical protein C5B59_21005 [Bacteroidetes bacterium]|nr:MAG: hypothetical protein C5B59_21005 [Bacteroidota bacterium]